MTHATHTPVCTASTGAIFGVARAESKHAFRASVAVRWGVAVSRDGGATWRLRQDGFASKRAAEEGARAHCADEERRVSRRARGEALRERVAEAVGVEVAAVALTAERFGEWSHVTVSVGGTVATVTGETTEGAAMQAAETVRRVRAA